MNVKVFIPFRQMETFPQQQNNKVTLGYQCEQLRGTQISLPVDLLADQVPGKNPPTWTVHQCLAPGVGKRDTLVLTRHAGEFPGHLIH